MSEVGNDLVVGSLVEFRFYRNRGDWKTGILSAYDPTPRWEANWQIEYPVFKNARDKRNSVVDHWARTPWMKRDLIRQFEWVKVD